MFLLSFYFKGTLMQISIMQTSAYVRVRNPENLTFLILRIILKLFAREVYEMFVYKHTETIEYIKK